jgi:hypothetical protein
VGLINHLAKACFVQRLSNERIQTIVRSKGETALLSTCIDAALEEESAILSARESGFSVQRGYGNKGEGSMFKGAARVSMQPSTGASMRGSGRGPGFIAQAESEGLMQPGRGVNMKSAASENRGAIRRECMSTGTRDSGRSVIYDNWVCNNW